MIGLKKILILICLSWALVSVKGIFAQGPPTSGDSQDRWEQREKIRENIQTLRTWKLLEVLDLTSEQSTKFMPALKDFQDAKKRFEDTRRELLKELETSLESKKDEKKLTETLSTLENNKKEYQMEQDKFLEKIKAILSLEQQAKLLLFEEKFEKRMRETIEQMRGKHSSGEKFER
jgi:Spy/CpxP family protein refolding chaperone